MVIQNISEPKFLFVGLRPWSVIRVQAIPRISWFCEKKYPNTQVPTFISPGATLGRPLVSNAMVMEVDVEAVSVGVQAYTSGKLDVAFAMETYLITHSSCSANKKTLQVTFLVRFCQAQLSSPAIHHQRLQLRQPQVLAPYPLNHILLTLKNSPQQIP